MNRQVRLAQRPVGLPGPETWELTEEAVPEPGEGEFLVRVEHLSLDPAMRGWLDDVRSYSPPVGVGEVMRALGAGTITTSRHPEFAEGDQVTGVFGVQEHAVSDGTGVRRLDPSVAGQPTWLGALGMPGLTAWFGLHDVARAKPGDVVLVSGAAGAVGSVVGQLAKRHGCQVVGVAGGPEKGEWLSELGFDAVVDYKAEPVGRALRRAAPEGVDVYFDNVGGETLDAALARLRRGARVVICGAISGYNATEPVPGPSRYLSLLVNRASMTGFLVFDYEDRFDEAEAELVAALRDGDLVAREQVVDGGVAAFGESLNLLFAGANTGKLVLAL